MSEQTIWTIWTEKVKNQERISELKNKLTSTDYAVIKIAEGSATAEEYADVIAQRKAWRDEINLLEQQSEDKNAAIEAEKEEADI